MTNYGSAIQRINKAKTVDTLKKLEVSFDRVYDAGHLTTSELSRLSSIIMERMVELEDGN